MPVQAKIRQLKSCTREHTHLSLCLAEHENRNVTQGTNMQKEVQVTHQEIAINQRHVLALELLRIPELGSFFIRKRDKIINYDRILFNTIIINNIIIIIIIILSLIRRWRYKPVLV